MEMPEEAQHPGPATQCHVIGEKAPHAFIAPCPHL